MPSFFQSVASFFNPQRDGPPAGRRASLSYTHDAFSLPTHSPTPDRLGSPTSSAPFTYPPPTPTTRGDDYSPYSSSDRLTRLQSAGPSILPLHSPSSSPHPPLAKTWARIRTWLSHEYPELGDTLNYGITAAQLADIELNLGAPLPSAVRESYLVTDGQEAESSAGCSEGLFFGLTLLPLDDVLGEWRLWREVDDDPTTGANDQLRDAMQSIPPNWIRREYSCRGWIPLIADRAGNYIGVDLDPGSSGQVGQVIVFGRDFDTKIVLWRGEGGSGWARWLASFAEELESGEGFELRGNDAMSDDDSEDSVGYDSYFFSGAGGGKGGDAGVNGGLRFTGEYKGWNAIEAWADRSYKRWYTAGLIPESSPSPSPSATSPDDSQAQYVTAGPSTGLRQDSVSTPTISVTAAGSAPSPFSPLPTQPGFTSDAPLTSSPISETPLVSLASPIAESSTTWSPVPSPLSQPPSKTPLEPLVPTRDNGPLSPSSTALPPSPAIDAGGGLVASVSDASTIQADVKEEEQKSGPGP